MFRTRDFILFFTAAVFLVLAIGTTVLKNYQPAAVGQPQITLSDTLPEEAGAVLMEPETLSRADHLESMRSKIAASADQIIAAPVAMAEPEQVSQEEDEEVTESPSVAVAQHCADYRLYTGAWPAGGGLSFEVVDGFRVMYETSSAQPAPAPPQSASGTSPLPVPAPIALVQLPIRTAAFPGTSCIASDVVGISKDGSLIRNAEAGLYSVFGEQTLVGYALDGFPIYGASSQPTDACGGVMVAGQYRYYLSSSRDTVIACFSAQPVTL